MASFRLVILFFWGKVGEVFDFFCFLREFRCFSLTPIVKLGKIGFLAHKTIKEN